MKTRTNYATSIFNRLISLLGLLLIIALIIPASAESQSSPSLVNLGTAGNFVIVAKTGISTTGTIGIKGDLGVSPYAACSIT